MDKLKSEYKTLIVSRLACYATPSEIRDELKLLKVDVTLQQICYYNPLSAQGRDQLDVQWKTLFYTIRSEFQQQLAVVPIADQSYRLYRLQKLIDDELLQKSPKTVMRALEQAAKETGGLYTRPEQAQEGADPNAIPQSLDNAVEKIYGDPDGGTGSEDPGPAGRADTEQSAAAEP